MMKLDHILQEVDIVKNKSKRDSAVSRDTPWPSKRYEHNKRSRDYQKRSDKSDRAVVGSGIEAIVFQSNKADHVGVVTKWLRNQSDDSTENSVINYLVDGQKFSFVPRVYRIKQIERKNGVYEFAIQMEKLHIDLTTYLKEYGDDKLMMRQLLTQVYKESYVDSVIDDIRLPKIHSMLVDFDDYSEYHNNRFLSFVEVLEKHNPDPQYDLHGENIMIRMTSTGAQLVYTDPIVGM